MSEPAAGVGRLSLVVIDCPDAIALGDFYAALLGVGVKDSDPTWVTLEGERPGVPALAFQRVPDSPRRCGRASCTRSRCTSTST